MADVTSTLDELFADGLQDQEFQEIYRRQKPLYDLVAEFINRRTDLGLTQKDLAKLANTFQSRISKIESGKHDFRLSTIIQIAEALQTEVLVRLVPFGEEIEKESEKNTITTEEFYNMINKQIVNSGVSNSSGVFEEPVLNTDWSSSVPELNRDMEAV